jgi:4-carboxymuconolactone decarboxylase
VARLPYMDKGASPQVDDVFAQVEALGRPVLNLYRVLANQPPALSAFLEMSRYVRDASSLDAGLREVVILATAHALDQPYEVAHHTAAAAKVGVPAGKIRAVAPGGSLEVLSVAERCAVDFAREVARTRTTDDTLFHRLESNFSPPQIVDLVVTTAWYHLCAVILGSLQVELEGGDR